MATNTTPPISYVNYDFDNLVTELQQLLSAQSAWKDMYRSSTGQTLLELFAAVGNLVLYYVERRAEESYISTAKNYSSVVNLARLLNYTPTRNISAIGPLAFTVDAPAPSLITIPQWTSVSSNAGVNFLVLDTNASIPALGTTATVSGIQGTLITKSFVSNGASNQAYNIDDTQIENSVNIMLLASVASLEVAQAIQQQTVSQSSYTVVNDDGTYSVYALSNPQRPQTLSVNVTGSSGTATWNQQSSFINSTNTSRDYVIRPELDGTLTVVFGNGVFGAFPQLGQTVVVTYVQSVGVAGNVFSPNLITTINSPIFYAGTTTMVPNISVTNTDTFLGGSDAETTAEIKENAPQVFSTGDRAVTKADFSAIIQNYSPGCNVVVYGENDINPPNYNMYNEVLISMILSTATTTPTMLTPPPNIHDWAIPGTTFQSNLAAYLYSKSMMTVRYSFVDPTIVYVVPHLTVRVDSSASITTVENFVESAVQGQFVLNSTTSLGQSIYQSDIIDAIEDVAGVKHCHVTLKVQKDMAHNLFSAYSWSTYADLLPVLKGSVELWVGTHKIAYDDGAGGWSNVGGSGYVVSGLVEYASVNTTSATSLTVGTGAQTLTVATGLKIATGTAITITHNNSNLMGGIVTSYTSGSGVLVVNVTSIVGAGTYTSWTVVDNIALIGANISGALPPGIVPFIKYQQDNSAIAIYSIGDLIVGQTQICQWKNDVYDYIGY